jgi:hypothetical protein
MLTSPFLLMLAEPTPDAAAASWIQVAKTGHFFSKKYGSFAIEKSDLESMLHNFNHVMPEPPTKLVVDYDHLTTTTPTMPGAAIAAGWVEELALRDNGETLWARCTWTPTAAQRIRDGEYRYVSPSFAKNHIHSNGREIGTTLLSVALTNSPFLAMAGVSLCNVDIMGDLAFSERGIPLMESSMKLNTVLHLTEIGQRVMIAPGHARTQDEIEGTFEVVEVVGAGDDAFASLKDAQGMLHKWFRMGELLPASSTPANPIAPALQSGQTPVKAGPVGNQPGADSKPHPNDGATGSQDKKSPKGQEATVNGTSANDRLLALAMQHATTHHLSLSAAVIAVSTEYRELAQTYLEESRTAVEQAPAAAPVQPISLRRDADAGEQLLSLANTIATERSISLSDATKLASRQRPELAAAWERGE